MLQLTDVAIYNLDNQLVLANASGKLNEEKSANAFNTTLNLSNAATNKLSVGDSYYAVGLTEGNKPVRSETVKCIQDGATPTFEGSIPFPQQPSNFAALGGSEADMLIQYNNYSQTTFDRSTWGANLQYGFGGLTTSPGPTLAAGAGQQSIGANQILSSVDEGPADVYLCWAQGINFGVWIHFNFQMFGIGPRPVWYVSTNGSAWALAGSNPADPYTWDSSAVGFNIVGTPNSGHSSLTVSVVITQLSNS